MLYQIKVLLIKANLIENLNDQQKVAKTDRYISSVVFALLENNDENYTGTHLDTHANMAVYEKHYWVIANTGFKACVTVFSDEIGQMLDVPIVDVLVL